MVAVPITPGMTEWAVSQQYHVSLGAVEAANSGVNPTDLQVGQTLIVPTGGSWAPASSPVHHQSSDGGKTYGVSYGDPNFCGDGDGDGWDVACQHSSPSSIAPVQHTQAPVEQAAPVQQSAPVQQAAPSSGGGGSSSGFHIPGMSDSMASCIAFRESTSGTNPAAGGNVFGIIPASGHNVAGDSLAQQEQVAGQIMATTGASAWSADGCPGT